MFNNSKGVFGSKNMEDLVEFEHINDKNNRGGFVKFKCAAEGIDLIIVTEELDSNENPVNPKPYFIEFLLRFPIIYFEDCEIKNYLFFPARRVEDNDKKKERFLFDSTICERYYVGKTILASYRYNNSPMTLALSESKNGNKKFSNIFLKKKRDAIQDKIYEIHKFEIITSTDKAYDNIWYEIADIENIKYPITEKSSVINDANDPDCGKYKYEFFVCTESGKTVMLKSCENVIRLNRADADSNTKEQKDGQVNETNAVFRSGKTDGSGEAKHDIYCLNTECMYVFSPDERSVKLKPPINVIELQRLYNSKLETEESAFTKTRKKRYDDDENDGDYSENTTDNAYERLFNLSITNEKMEEYVNLKERWKYSIHQILFGNDIAKIFKADINMTTVKKNQEELFNNAQKNYNEAVSAEKRKFYNELDYANRVKDYEIQKAENELKRIKEIAKENGIKTDLFLFYYGQFLKNDYERILLSEKLNKNDINDYVSDEELIIVRNNMRLVGDTEINVVEIGNVNYIPQQVEHDKDSSHVFDVHGQVVSDFICPKCQHPLLKKQGNIETHVILLVGDTEAGKSVYLANTLRAYLSDPGFLGKIGISVNIVDETIGYLDSIKDDIGKGYQATSDISKPLYFRIKNEDIEKYLVIYDMPGEWFSNEEYYEQRVGKLLRVFRASRIILFLYPIDKLHVEGREKTTPHKFIERVMDDIFNGTLPAGTAADQSKLERKDLNRIGLNDRKMAFILSKIDKWAREGSELGDNERVFFHKVNTSIDKLLELEGIESSLDICVSDTKNEKKKYMNEVIDKEIEITRKFFQQCLMTESAVIVQELLPRGKSSENYAFFSYGSPEDADYIPTIQSRKRYAAIRPFNSIQWIINQIFE